jgi:hypothetical protein
VEHVIPHGKDLQVHSGDHVKAGDGVVRGPLVPQDILRVSGPEEVQQYLLHEIQNVYRAQAIRNWKLSKIGHNYDCRRRESIKCLRFGT